MYKCTGRPGNTRKSARPVYLGLFRREARRARRGDRYRTVQAGPVQAPVDDKKNLISPRLPPEKRRREVLVLYGYKQKAEMVAVHDIFELKELLMAEIV